MAFTNVDYKELTDPEMSEGADDQGGWAHKSYGVSWADRFQFTRDVMGYSSMSGGIAGTWNRKYPLAYPDDPHLYARGVEIKPHGAWYKTTPLTYDHAVVTVTFRAPEWSFSTADDPLFLNSFSQDETENAALVNCTQTLEWSVEWLPIPNAVATLQTSGNKITTPMAKRVTVVRMVLTWTDLPYMPISGVLAYADVLNDAKFLGRPKGTVMLEGPKTTRKRMADGTVVQDLTLSLKTRANDWNKVLTQDGTWDTVIFNADPTKNLFPYVNMKPLLFVGSSS
jgi:hypothetical protein